jgi:hypothetical protein
MADSPAEADSAAPADGDNSAAPAEGVNSASGPTGKNWFGGKCIGLGTRREISEGRRQKSEVRSRRGVARSTGELRNGAASGRSPRKGEAGGRWSGNLFIDECIVKAGPSGADGGRAEKDAPNRSRRGTWDKAGRWVEIAIGELERPERGAGGADRYDFGVGRRIVSGSDPIWSSLPMLTRRSNDRGSQAKACESEAKS